ncbi:MAG: FAD:protein FMN transferase [Thermodesulfovibrionales bacterium]|nr:FAD:protein FMN transferase [Thermodesulfovibrionales bacterium]
MRGSLPIKITTLVMALFIMAIMAIMAGCAEQKELEKQSQSTDELFRKRASIMHTNVSVTVAAGSSEQADKAIEAAFSKIRELEGLLSFWTEDSEIAAINRNAGKKAVRVSAPTLEILERAMEISDWTDGAFDATVGPVIRQWDFNEQTLPEPEALKAALDKVDYRALEIDTENSTAYLGRPEMSFDTGGIAKGFAADAAIDVLKAQGISAALVSVSGDIRAYGRKPDGTEWRVGIKNPRSDDPNSFIASLSLNDEAISTSGDYERFFIKDGRRYHHILDPRTGQPAEGSMSVTVIADSATYTDGLSTGIFVMGPEKGIKVLEEHGFQGVLIGADGETYITGGLAGRLRMKKK